VWTSHRWTRGTYLANVKVPRGPVMGCHVEPIYWFIFIWKKLESIVVEPMTSGLGGEWFGRVWATNSPALVLGI
jgi:hypothetical protein